MTTFSIAISKQAISEMPAEVLEGNITLVDTPQALADALADLSKQTIVGFDTETKPSFKKGCVNKVALMQLSTETQNYLIRLNRLGIPEPLQRFLENPDILKVGVSVHDDFSVLRRVGALEPKGFIELQQVVKKFHIADSSLQKIYAIVFGKRISKKQRLTNWEAETLTPQQQAYAALDARACLNLYFYLKEGKFDPETSPYRVVSTPENHANTNQS
ncbi:MAG: 3'-5' exonuclease domain-containing protein 2 [Muribaculaceae bacterium]|nr:3'-5' exonuclease domain-containing protein 2 [Muribaculaceae bacterium]